MEKELSRTQSTLRMLGSGNIVFALWDIIKPFLIVLFLTDETGPTAAADADTAFSDAVMKLGLTEKQLILVVVLLLILVVGTFLRLFLGFAARAEGLGKRRGWGYVVFSFILFISQVILLTQSLWILFKYGLQGADPLELAASMILEISSAAIICETAFTAVKFKRLKRQRQEAEK